VQDEEKVHDVLFLSNTMLLDHNLIVAEYVHDAKTHVPQIKPDVLYLAGRQLMLAEKCAMEANTVHFYANHYASLSEGGRRLAAAAGDPLKPKWDALNATIKLFTDSHYKLLKGSVADHIPETTSVCVIWTMNYVKTAFDQLQDALLQIGAGSSYQIGIASDQLPHNHELVLDAFHFYEYGAETCNTIWNVSSVGWKAAISEASLASSLTMKLTSEVILAGLPGMAADSSSLGNVKTATSNSLDAVKFGSASVPAVPSEAFLPPVSAMHDMAPSFMQAANQGDVDQTVNKSMHTQVRADAVVDLYIAGADLGVIGARMKLVSRQLMLANKFAMLASLNRFYATASSGNGSASQATTTWQYTSLATNSEIEAVALQFDIATNKLEVGGDGAPKIIEERQDLTGQVGRVTSAFANLRLTVAEVLTTLNFFQEKMTNMRIALIDLELELNNAMVIFSEADPIVIEETEFPWTLLIYFGVITPWVCGATACAVVQGSKYWRKQSATTSTNA